MAECLNSKQEVDNVKCGICLSAFTKPILLDCFHIYCTPCVTKLVEGKETLICPLCRAVHILPDKGVGGLSLYPYVQEGSPPKSNVKIICQMCNTENNAISNCIDCNSKMCVECSSYHLKHNIFKSHKTETIEIECTDIIPPETKVPKPDTCEIHNIEFSLYCESCNRAICKECVTQNHKFHKCEPIMFQTNRRRDLLRSAISVIKSKIAGIDQEREMSKYTENNHYKQCRLWKEEIRSHTQKSKETVCKIMDLLADVNLTKIDEIQKQEIKSLINFQDVLETKKLSLQCLLRSTEDIVKRSCGGELLNGYAFLYQTLSNAVKEDNQLEVFAPQFCFGNQLDHKHIENCFGFVKRGERPNIIGAMNSHIYSLPNICGAIEWKKIHSDSFKTVLSLFGVCEDKAWILHEDTWSGDYIQLHSVKGSDLGCQIPRDNAEQILRATQNELWVKSDIVIKKITVGINSNQEEIVRLVEFAGTNCFLIDDNCIVAYSVEGKFFHEVNIDQDWPVNIDETTLKTIPVEEKLAAFVTEKPFRITQTLSKHIILTCKDKVITLDRNYMIYNIHEKKGSEFRGICGDPYGNIFIVDYNSSKICLFNSNGDFLHYVSVQGLSNIVDITRDSVGNIWLANQSSNVHIYSYL
ncbi:tripartite motif-containing protein 2/3 [Mytilus galloprovincialis]|uniref:Tripartite motif-containing protein 2/3 n=1 Tax=Mytilus galloprovincialis TaxID=29158 RepID=A0A8B6BGP2_MYTGA|nr:tripartite motif-containing protein 2/3 [Mytilus galloprovincialis]